MIVTEKIHGANARYVVENDVFSMGSRTRWLRPDVGHHWKRAADADPRIETWCRRNPGVVLYGEVYGAVQSLKYGQEPGHVAFAAFAAMGRTGWWDTRWLVDDASLPTSPVLYRGIYDAALVLPLAEGNSKVIGAPANHMMEGIVIALKRERKDGRIGRVVLKHISNRYWESAA